MSFQKKDANVASAGLPKRENRSQNGFRTDSAISGGKIQGERPLQRWVADSSVNTDLSLEGSNGSSNLGNWDQFAENAKLFGVKTDYREDIYTTTIDKSNPEYQKRMAKADRIAREIERSTTNNAHVLEERIRDNLTADKSGRDEEDKYSGVDRSDFPPLASTDRSNKYTPPARRPPTGQSTVSGAPVDPAIISAQLARPQKPAAEAKKVVVEPKKTAAEPAKLAQAPATPQPEVKTPPTTTESSFGTTPEPKATPSNTSTLASRTASPQARPAGTPNATATVEKDLLKSFKGFADQQRNTVDKIRSNKAKADKDSKLNDLKQFAQNFKLSSPVPSDLVLIITKDPVKQKEIQEKAKRDAEEVKQGKLNAASPNAKVGSTPDARTPQRPAASPQGATSSAGAPSRQSTSRPTATTPQGPYAAQSFRPNGTMPTPPATSQQGRQNPGLATRLRGIEQSRTGQVPAQFNDGRQPPTGPANGGDPNFSRRPSGAMNMLGGKLNPNSHEFRPSPFAASFSPNGNPSTGSSPRSNSTSTPSAQVPSASAPLLRRRQLQGSAKPTIRGKFNILNKITSASAKAADNGGTKPAYDTQPTWRQIRENEKPDSTMHLTYAKIFENLAYSRQTISPAQPSHVHPQVPHQHQLPFHLQQGAHGMNQRPSPRAPPVHMNNNHHNNHGPNNHYNPDDHRMMPSHSAQSFAASPRIPQVPIAYPSPMGQPAQLAYNPAGMQFPMAPNTPQMQQFRSYSGGPSFVPPQGAHMAGPMMIQPPGPNGFMPGPGMPMANPQMYPVGGHQFVPQGPPPVMPGANGYPSPGRTAPMMMQQGSQHGQPVYGMSPGMQYGQPIYAQQPSGQMPNMRGYQGQQQFGTSPQMHQYGQPNRGTPSGSYNKNYQNHQGQHGQHSQHPPQQNQVPTGPQARPDAGDESK